MTHKEFQSWIEVDKNVELGPEESIDELVKSIKAQKELEDADKPEDEEETLKTFSNRDCLDTLHYLSVFLVNSNDAQKHIQTLQEICIKEMVQKKVQSSIVDYFNVSQLIIRS